MSSTPLVAWRTFMPSFLAQPWRRYQILAVDDVERLDCAIRITQRLSHYLTALFAAHTARPQQCKPLQNLIKGIDRATDGKWWLAAQSLAKNLISEEGPIGLAARTLEDEETDRHLQILIDVRNSAAHPSEGGVGLNDSTARLLLPEVDASLHHVVRAFACIADMRLLVVRSSRMTTDGVHAHDAVIFGATDGLRTQINTPAPLPCDKTFVASSTGSLVSIDAWVRTYDSAAGLVPLLLSPDKHTKTLMTYRGAHHVVAEWPDERPYIVLNKSVARYSLDARSAAQICGGSLGSETPEVSGWKLVQQLGSGGNAETWLAYAESGSAQDLRVLKIIHAAAQSDVASVQRLRREIEIGTHVRHPGLARCLGPTETTLGRSVMIQEYIEGVSLKRRLRQHPRLTPPQIVRMGREVGMALLALHEAGIIHRDVKPANILIDDTGHARLIDLGVAHLDGAPHITQLHHGIGTAEYSSPEQQAGAPATPAADAYSLGRVLQAALKTRYTQKRVREAPTKLLALTNNLLSDKPSTRLHLATAVAALHGPEILDDGQPVVVGDLLPGGWTVCAAPARITSCRDAWAAPVRAPSGQQTTAWVAMGTRGPKAVRDHAGAKNLGVTELDGLTVVIRPPTASEPQYSTASAVGAGVATGVLAMGLAGLGVLGAGALGAVTVGAAAGLAKSKEKDPVASDVAAPKTEAKGPRVARSANTAALAANPLLGGIKMLAKAFAARKTKPKR